MEPMALLPDDVRRKIAGREFRPLKSDLRALSAASLAALWPGLAPFDKITVFKLLDPVRARGAFAEMPSGDRALMLGARERGVLGPLLEGMRAEEAAELFPTLSDEDFRALTDGVR
jgi:Mg/Co/Ni transporter MgtE